MTGHHPDCHGYRFEHRCTVERVWHGAAVSHTFRAVCEECGQIHPGTFGPSAYDACLARANAHGREVLCDGRCLAWNDPDYAETDEDGQLSIGVAGEQRAIPGLARRREHPTFDMGGA